MNELDDDSLVITRVSIAVVFTLSTHMQITINYANHLEKNEHAVL